VTDDKVCAWRGRDTLAAVALFVATAAFVLWQNAHVAVLWDLSYLLDSSWRIALGQMPYRDFPFAHAPLTFLVQAAIIRLGGRVYWHQVAYAAAADGAATLLAWRIMLRVLAGRAGAGSAGAGIAGVGGAWWMALALSAPLTVVGIYGIFPHPYYDPDAVLAVLLAVWLLQRALGDGARGASAVAVLAGAACVLPLFYKQNIGLPFLAATLAALVAIAAARRMQGQPAAQEWRVIAGALAALAAALATIQLTAGLRNYIHWTIAFAAQRRLPGMGVMLGIFLQTSLAWTVPAALVAVALLRRKAAWARAAALALLAAPFLWTMALLPATDDVSDRADQLLSLWPHLLLLGILLAVCNLRRAPSFRTMLPAILLATTYGTFLSQQLWGSTYGAWPLLMLLIAGLLVEVPSVARPLAGVVALTLLVCGGAYAASHERLSYTKFDGAMARATLPALAGMRTPGPWIPQLEELVRFTDTEIPAGDAILLVPGEDPFYFATGRVPRFPVLMFDPATDPYSPQDIVRLARERDVRWLVLNRELQVKADPTPNIGDYIAALKGDFELYRLLGNYEIYRRR
jgi:hypothetical protein